MGDITQTTTESSSISSISLNGGKEGNGDILCIGQPNFPNQQQIIAGRCVCYNINKSETDSTYTKSIIGQPIYGNEQDEKLGSVVELSKDGSILSITSSGVNVVRLYHLQNGQIKQIEPDDMKPKDDTESLFGSSVTLSMDGYSLYVGSPTSSNDIGDFFGITYSYAVDTLNEAESTS